MIHSFMCTLLLSLKHFYKVLYSPNPSLGLAAHTQCSSIWKLENTTLHLTLHSTTLYTIQGTHHTDSSKRCRNRQSRQIRSVVTWWATAKRWVLRFHFKEEMEGACLSLVGKEFQTLGTQKKKDRSPMCIMTKPQAETPLCHTSGKNWSSIVILNSSAAWWYVACFAMHKWSKTSYDPPCIIWPTLVRIRRKTPPLQQTQFLVLVRTSQFAHASILSWRISSCLHSHTQVMAYTIWLKYIKPILCRRHICTMSKHIRTYQNTKTANAHTTHTELSCVHLFFPLIMWPCVKGQRSPKWCALAVCKRI